MEKQELIGVDGNSPWVEFFSPRRIGAVVVNIMPNGLRERAGKREGERGRTEGSRRNHDGWVVSSGDWPSGIQRDDLTVEEIFDALDTVDDLADDYDNIMDGLANPANPATTTQ